jgi:hypothetical protein
MPWNGSGVFNRLFSWIADKAGGINITASRFDADENDIVSNGLGNALTRDGQGVPVANLPMAGFRHLNVASSQNRNEYLATAQLQDGGPIWGGTSTGAANTYQITLAPAVTALVAGMTVRWFSHQANTGAATLKLNGITGAITRNGATALTGGEIPNAAVIEATFDGTIAAPGRLPRLPAKLTTPPGALRRRALPPGCPVPAGRFCRANDRARL